MAELVYPQELIQLGQNYLGIHWSDGHRSSYPVRKLRLECRCAGCVDEWTQKKKITESSVPESVRPVTIESVGRYAFHIAWSDGHGTGYYTFALLRDLCECERCKMRLASS